MKVNNRVEHIRSDSVPQESPQNRPRANHVRRRLTLGRRAYYLLERLSGRERYRAFDPGAGPKGGLRAIHVLPRTDQTYQYVKALERASQNNTNFPSILSYHVLGDRVYLVLPWIRGRTLRRYIDDSRKKHTRGLGVFETVKLMRGFAHGLTQLSHRKNMVHGDIKPENLIICREPNRLVAIDFGSAWVVECTAKRTETEGFTGPYAAPELQRGEAFVDFRSDIFSASIVYYEMLTLALPYDGIGGLVAMSRYSGHLSTLVPPSQLCRMSHLLSPSVWKMIDQVVLKGMSLDANMRYQNRRDWLGAMEDIRFELDKAARFEDQALLTLNWNGLWGKLCSRLKKGFATGG